MSKSDFTMTDYPGKRGEPKDESKLPQTQAQPILLKWNRPLCLNSRTITGTRGGTWKRGSGMGSTTGFKSGTTRLGSRPTFLFGPADWNWNPNCHKMGHERIPRHWRNRGSSFGSFYRNTHCVCDSPHRRGPSGPVLDLKHERPHVSLLIRRRHT